jgi:hypothetical protein
MEYAGRPIRIIYGTYSTREAGYILQLGAGLRHGLKMLKAALELAHHYNTIL